MAGVDARNWSKAARATLTLSVFALSAIMLWHGFDSTLSTALILLGSAACLLQNSRTARLISLSISCVLIASASYGAFPLDQLLLAPMGVIACEGMIRIRRRLVSAELAANIDHLTGALTPRGFARVLEKELSSALRDGRSTALVFIDLDHFKVINDNFGHAAGDRVLSDLVQKLKNRLFSDDHICRVGGDEFLVFLRYADDAGRLEAFQGKIMEALSELSHNVSASAGGLILPPIRYQDPVDIIQRADQLMYDVKNSGRGRIRFSQIAYAG